MIEDDILDHLGEIILDEEGQALKSRYVIYH